jgi:late competence protein required for DNA uptake (superfamily II DNA/RNA helicase)
MPTETEKRVTAKKGNARCVKCGKLCEKKFMSTTLGRLFCSPECALKGANDAH